MPAGLNNGLVSSSFLPFFNAFLAMCFLLLQDAPTGAHRLICKRRAIVRQIPPPASSSCNCSLCSPSLHSASAPIAADVLNISTFPQFFQHALSLLLRRRRPNRCELSSRPSRILIQHELTQGEHRVNAAKQSPSQTIGGQFGTRAGARRRASLPRPGP